MSADMLFIESFFTIIANFESNAIGLIPEIDLVNIFFLAFTDRFHFIRTIFIRFNVLIYSFQ